MIDPDWVSVTDERGVRRLDDPHDFVRLEVESALARGIPVLPLLVEGAVPMRAEELPPSIQPLARKQALVLSEARTVFEADTDRIIRSLEDFGLVPEKGVRRKEQTAGSVSWACWLMPIFGVIGGAIAWAFVRSENRRRARSLLIAGIVVTLIAVSVGIGAASQNSNQIQPPPPPTTTATVSRALRSYLDVSQAVVQFVKGSASEEDIAAAFGRQSAEYQIGNEVVARFGTGLPAGDPVAVQGADDLVRAGCTHAYPG